jgi:hypothetical protein
MSWRDSCVYWLDLIVRAKLVEDAFTLRGEFNELRAIFSKSLGTARANRRAAANSAHGGRQQIVIVTLINDDQMTR